MDHIAALAELLIAGGLSMLPLLGCSIAAAAATIQLMVRHASARVGRARLLDEPVHAESLDLLEALCQADRSALGDIMVLTITALRERPHAARDEARRAIDQRLLELEAGLAMLAYIAQAAPLFGLLGTVVGMVDLFSAMEAAGDKVSAATLASGIWKALITTVTGLCIAIPALGLHTWFSRRLDRLALHMEEGSARILDRAGPEGGPRA